MESKQFNQLIAKIEEGEVGVQSLETGDFTDGSDSHRYFDGSIDTERELEVDGYTINYTVVGSCSYYQESPGGYMEPEEWSDPDFDVEFEVTSVYDPEGDEIYLHGTQLERLAKVIENNSY